MEKLQNAPAHTIWKTTTACVSQTNDSAVARVHIKFVLEEYPLLLNICINKTNRRAWSELLTTCKRELIDLREVFYSLRHHR